MSTSAREYPARKTRLRQKLGNLLDNYSKILIIAIDNVRSKQLAEIRMILRTGDDQAEVLMGKNSVLRTYMRAYAKKNNRDDLAYIIEALRLNVGLVFTNNSLDGVRRKIIDNKVPASAKAGSLAPCDVFVPAGPTGIDPGETMFFQTLNIPTKIARNAIEITNTVHLIKEGDRVNASAATLLDKLNIKPFFYSIIPKFAFEDGLLYESALLELTEETYVKMFNSACSILAAVGLESGVPNFLSVPHSVLNGFKLLLAISVETDCPNTYAEEIKDALKNPEKYASAAPAAAAGATAAAAEEEEEEEEESDDMEGGMDLFG